MVLAGVETDRASKEAPAPVEPDVYVDIEGDGNRFVRIPVTEVEMWANKDGPASISRSARVKFPAEWGGADITQYVDGFSNRSGGQTARTYTQQSQYDEARVFFRDYQTGEYVLSHYGYVGSVGPANQSGVMKLWIYDPADLLRRIPVSKGFRNVGVSDILNFVVNGQDDTGQLVGLNHRTTFDTIDVQVLGSAENSEVGSLNVGPFELSFSDSFPLDSNEFTIPEPSQESSFLGQKSFVRNKDNLVSVMNWLSENMDGSWHFEPAPNGPILTVDLREEPNASRRLFRETEIEDALPDELGVFNGEYRTIHTLHNDALQDIKPINYAEVYGETSRNRDNLAKKEQEDNGLFGLGSLQDPAIGIDTEVSDFSESTSSSGYTEEYPYAKAVYQPLLDRAGGYEYGPAPVNGDAKYLEEAENQARSELKKHLQESTEGTIKLHGAPFIVPRDIIQTIAVCEGTYQNTDMAPITYEVNQVRHYRTAGERYITEINGSFVFLESEVTVESRYEQA